MFARPVRRLLALSVLATTAVLVTSAAARDTRAAVRVDCSRGLSATSLVRPVRDVEIGPLVLIGGGRWTAREPNGFSGKGYKIPVTLPEGARATLSVPAAMKGRVGFVYTTAAKKRVLKRGVEGADSSVEFTACPAGEEQGRTGWPGGFVIDRPRCVTLIVSVPGEPPARRRVAIGGRC